MATTNVQVAQAPSVYAIAVYNASTTTDIPAYQAVTVDTSNGLTNTVPQIAVTLPGTATPANVVGFTQATIYAGNTGKMIPVGFVSNAVCYGTVNAGSVVDNCTVPSFTGRVQAHTAAQAQVAIALAAGIDGDTIPIVLCAAKDA